MLSGMVNIAVFAAFHCCFDGRSFVADAAFKPVCRFGNVTFGVMGGKNGKKRQHGWQKWQETATWVAKTARVGRFVAASASARLRLHAGEGGCLRLYGVVKVLAARVAPQ